METNHLDLKCRHNLLPTIYTSKKQPGRQFYRCPKPIGEEQCNFFLWLDEAIPSPSQNRFLPPTPQSAQASGPTLREPPSTPTPLSRKRTSPDDMLTSSYQSQKRARHDDETEGHSGPLMSPSLEGIHFTQSPITPGKSLNTYREREPSMSQETVSSEVSEELSADSVARKLRFFNELPDYIRKLEKRKVAAEMSRDAKARKIQDLQAEVERLRQREKELEDLVTLLES